MAVRRRYVDVAHGHVHVTEAGAGRPVVLLHQTPRSADEFAEVLPLLGRRRWAIAVDLPGMGGSDPHPAGATIEAYAAGVLAAVDALGVVEFDLVGHHTGGVVAVEIAATVPDRVGVLVLSSTPYIDADERQRRGDRVPVDEVGVADDGSHLQALWQARQRFYPPGRIDLLRRFVGDAVRTADPAEGHRAVAAYEMEARLPLLRARTVLIGHADDPFAFPELPRLAAAIGHPETIVIEGGVVPLEASADEFSAIVDRVLSA